jgi:hypothetical protein
MEKWKWDFESTGVKRRRDAKFLRNTSSVFTLYAKNQHKFSINQLKTSDNYSIKIIKKKNESFCTVQDVPVGNPVRY